MRTDQHAPTLQSAAADIAVDVDLLFDALTSPRRRYVLAHLQQAESALALSDLATDVAHWELDSETASVPEDTRKAIYVSLHHVHLPKLADAGLLTYDQETETVDTTAAGQELTTLDCLPHVD